MTSSDLQAYPQLRASPVCKMTAMATRLVMSTSEVILIISDHIYSILFNSIQFYSVLFNSIQFYSYLLVIILVYEKSEPEVPKTLLLLLATAAAMRKIDDSLFALDDGDRATAACKEIGESACKNFKAPEPYEN